MLRAVLGAVVGYVVMSLFIGVLLFGAYAVLGSDRSYQPRSYAPSTLWFAVMFAVGFVGAVIGGFLARKIGRSAGAQALLALMIVLGLAMTGFAIASDEGPPAERTGDVPLMEAMLAAKTPVWAMLANLGVGIVGVLVGAAKAGGRKH